MALKTPIDVVNSIQRVCTNEKVKLTWSSFTSTFWLLLVQWWFVSGQIVFRGGLFCLASLVVIEWSILLLNAAVSRTYQNSSKRSNRNIPSLFWIVLNEKSWTSILISKDEYKYSVNMIKLWSKMFWIDHQTLFLTWKVQIVTVLKDSI